MAIITIDRNTPWNVLRIKRVIDAAVENNWAKGAIADVLKSSRGMFLCVEDPDLDEDSITDICGVIAISRSNFDWDVYEISNFYVHPNYQRQGKGKALLTAAIDELRSKANYVVCSTSTAEELFTSFGFKRIHCYDGKCLMMLNFIELDE